MDTEICPGYCGVSCVDGSCPIANQEIYQEYGIPVIRSCSECPYYYGCDDCCFSYNKELCVKYDEVHT